MIRFLSAAWFERLRDVAPGEVAPEHSRAGDPLVLRHVVGPGSDTSTGTVGYDVVVDERRAVIRHPSSGVADLTFTSDWATAAAIAAGQLSTQAALAGGRLRVAGDVSILARRAGEVAGMDPVPVALRAETDFRP